MKMIPQQNRLLVTIKENPYQKPTKIITNNADSLQRQYFYAKVVAVGPDVTGFKVEDEIYFPLQAGYPLDFNGKDYALIRDMDVMIKISKDDNSSN